MRKQVYLKNVSTLRFNPDLCVGCGTCLEVCPREVFARDNGKVKIIDFDACMECGACSRNCAVQAIYVKPGVGCAAAIINSALGRKGSSCCCVIEPEDSASPSCSNRSSGCC